MFFFHIVFFFLECLQGYLQYSPTQKWKCKVVARCIRNFGGMFLIKLLVFTSFATIPLAGFLLFCTTIGWYSVRPPPSLVHVYTLILVDQCKLCCIIHIRRHISLTLLYIFTTSHKASLASISCSLDDDDTMNSDATSQLFMLFDKALVWTDFTQFNFQVPSLLKFPIHVTIYMHHLWFKYHAIYLIVF